MPQTTATTSANTPIQPDPAHVQKIGNYCTHTDYSLRLSGIRRIVNYVTGNTNHAQTPYVPLLEKLALPTTEKNEEVRRAAMSGISSLVIHELIRGNQTDPHKDFVKILSDSLRTETDTDVMKSTLRAVGIFAPSINSLVPALYDMVQRTDIHKECRNDARIVLTTGQISGVIKTTQNSPPAPTSQSVSAHLTNAIIAPDFSTATTNAKGMTEMFGRITYVPPQQNTADIIQQFDGTTVKLTSPTKLYEIERSSLIHMGLTFNNVNVQNRITDPIKGTYFEAESPAIGKLDY